MNLKIKQPILFLAALVLLITVVFLNSGTVRAAGALISDGTAGQYHISVWASPNPVSVGKITLTIRIGQKAGVDQEWPVRNATVKVQFKQLTGPGTEANPRILVTRNVLVAPEADPGTYEVADSLPAEGKYQLQLNIENNSTSTPYSIEITALPQPDDRLFSIFLLVMIALFIFGLVISYLHQSGQANQAKEQASEATPKPLEEIVKK
jgi:preprotein translocase subunit SecG